VQRGAAGQFDLAGGGRAETVEGIGRRDQLNLQPGLGESALIDRGDQRKVAGRLEALDGEAELHGRSLLDAGTNS
jgi:hypothetical protein